MLLVVKLNPCKQTYDAISKSYSIFLLDLVMYFPDLRKSFKLISYLHKKQLVQCSTKIQCNPFNQLLFILLKVSDYALE